MKEKIDVIFSQTVTTIWQYVSKCIKMGKIFNPRIAVTRVCPKEIISNTKNINVNNAHESTNWKCKKVKTKDLRYMSHQC